MPKYISQYFEKAIQVNLGDFYHAYLEIKSRKINLTKFLAALPDGLNRRHR